jgi:Tol biopolymer transport system component
VTQITNNDHLDTEPTWSPDGTKIALTRLELPQTPPPTCAGRVCWQAYNSTVLQNDIYGMNADGTNEVQLTEDLGQDNNPGWSPDGTKIVYRAWHPVDSALTSYRDLLAQRLVRPNRMELWVMNADGTGQLQITQLGGANFGPSWTPDGRRLIFSSNYRQPRSGNFDLYLVNLDGSGLEQITTDETFDGFPMFSPDGRSLVWASNRHDAKAGETNLFIADWAP